MLFTAPLLKVKSPETPSLIILDALDELPKQGQKPLLSVITAQLSTLPKWLRLFVTSREEPQIKAALAKFKPKELRADEAKNRADVEVRWTQLLEHQLICKVLGSLWLYCSILSHWLWLYILAMTVYSSCYGSTLTMAIRSYTHHRTDHSCTYYEINTGLLELRHSPTAFPVMHSRCTCAALLVSMFRVM